MEVLKIENLKKYFPINKELTVHAVSGINFSIDEGETLGLVGESGCGNGEHRRCNQDHCSHEYKKAR